MMSTWSHDLACDVIYLFITSSTISTKLQDDEKPQQPHYHQQHTPPTYYQNKWKHLRQR